MNDVVLILVIFVIHNTWALVRLRRRIKKLEERMWVKAPLVPERGILRVETDSDGQGIQEEKRRGR
jgi:hypothetical protein